MNRRWWETNATVQIDSWIIFFGQSWVLTDRGTGNGKLHGSEGGAEKCTKDNGRKRTRSKRGLQHMVEIPFNVNDVTKTVLT